MFLLNPMASGRKFEEALKGCTENVETCYKNPKTNMIGKFRETFQGNLGW